MKLATWLGLAGLLAGTALGCGDDASSAPDGGARGDGGARADASTERDSGPLVWRPRDAGRTPDADVIDTPLDSGTANRECAQRRTPLPAMLLPRCSADTRDCIAACPQSADPEACREACIDADPTPPEPRYNLDCGACIYLQLFACIDAADCHEGVADVFCCLADRCPSGSPEGCGDQMCAREIEVAVTCGYFADMSCLDFLGGMIDECYAPSSGDADAGAP